MPTLYQFPTSPFCEKVRRVLNLKGVHFDIVDVDRRDLDGLQAISPYGRFPVIVHDGAVIRDSTEIALHLDAAFPDPPIYPTDPRDRALAHVLEDWADESLYFYEITMRFAWENNIDQALPALAASMPGISYEALRANMLAKTRAGLDIQGLGRKDRAEVVRDVERHFESVECLLRFGDWLIGAAPGIADIAVAVQVRALLYAEECEPLLACSPHLEDWLGRLEEVAPATAPSVVSGAVRM